MSRALEALAVGLLLGLLAGLVIGRSAAATPRQTAIAIPADAWRSVEASEYRPAGGDASPSPTLTVAAIDVPATEGPSPDVSVSATANPRQTSPKLAVTGTASWYCLPGRSACTKGYAASGLFAAAGPALRVGAWRGRMVSVCVTVGNCLSIRLVDTCQCYGSGGRIIDLYASVWAALGVPLSAGLVKVTVRWV